jgi:hypothetical protein
MQVGTSSRPAVVAVLAAFCPEKRLRNLTITKFMLRIPAVPLTFCAPAAKMIGGGGFYTLLIGRGPDKE